MSTHNICFHGEIRKIFASKALLMSTYNICFHGEIRKISAFFRMKKAPYLLL